jgi:hypothetical protein
MKPALQQPVTLLELTKVLQERVPGPDRVIVEFYLALWHVMGHQYLKMLLESIRVRPQSNELLEVLTVIISQCFSTFHSRLKNYNATSRIFFGRRVLVRV